MTVLEAGSCVYYAKQRAGNLDIWDVHRYQILGVILKLYLLVLHKDILDVSQFKMVTASLDDMVDVPEDPAYFGESDLIYKLFKSFSTEGLYRFCADLIPNHYIEGDHVFFEVEENVIHTLRDGGVFEKLNESYEAYHGSK